MAITLNGTTGITNDGGYTGDGVSFADTTPANTLVTDTSGNVGIGIASPSTKLTVAGSTQIQTGTFPATGNGLETTFTASNTAFIQAYDRGAAVWRDIVTGGATLQYQTGGSERMRIDSSGNLLVGATATLADHKALIKQTGALPCLALQVTGSSFQNMVSFYSTAGVIKGSISSPGDTSVAYNTSSDYRLKENIAPMTGALAKVQQLKPVTYTWKDSGQAWEGFIAHEVQEIVPNAVTGEKDAVDAEGNPQYQGIDTSFLVATLTAAIQELKTIVDQQSTELDSVKATVDLLSTEVATLKGAA